MKSFSEIKRNIKSIKSTETITKTMKLVASARIRKAQKLILGSRPFADKLREMTGKLASDLEGDETFRNSWVRWFLNKRKQTKNTGLLVISSDRGLCGAFNTVLLKETLKWIKENENKKIFTFIVGRKALNFLGRLKKFNIEIVNQMTGIFPKVSYANARIMGESIIKTYREKKLERLTVIYSEFTSMLSQTVKTYAFLPLSVSKPDENNEEYNFIFEPGKEKILHELVPRYINALTYKMLLESQAAELAARMNAMDSASTNAKDMIDDLTVKLNRIRQESITTEIAEIVGGMEALKG